jgi:fucose permease
LRLREARRGLGRDLVDVGEDGLAQVVQRVGLEPRAGAGLDEPPPRPACADAVGGEERVQRAPGLVLAGAEPRVGVARAGVVGRLADQQVDEAVERDLDAEAHDLAEPALHRAGVTRDLGGDRGDDVVRQARQRGAERVRRLRRERRLGRHYHQATRIARGGGRPRSFAEAPLRARRSLEDRSGYNAGGMTPRAATFATFAVNGAMIGTWVAHIPWLQERLDVSKSTIGLALLCMAAGALVAMPLTGQVLAGRSSAQVTRIATLIYCLLLPLPLIAPSPVALGAILFVFGAANGAMDVSMNAHGVAVERDLGRPIMSSLHGGWSLGGFAAAGFAALTGAAGLDPRVLALGVGIGLWLAAWWITARLGSASTHGEASGFALPSRGVILIGVLCFLTMVTEGAIGDWSGIYLRQDLGSSAAAAATGFTGFSLGMAVARLGGDWLNERLGAGTLLRAGMSLVALALATVLLIGRPVPAVIGFGLIGLGIANAVPILFSAAGRHEPAAPSLAAVFTVGYTGFIVGPPLIGVLGDTIGLPQTLALLCVSALAVTVLGRRATAPVATPASRR